MKLPVRIILVLLCAALIVSMPFFLSSPDILPEAINELEDDTTEEDDGKVLDFGKLFFPYAAAEGGELTVEDMNEGEKLSIPDEWALPLDFSLPPMPDPDRFTENGYEDQSIRVRIETRERFGSYVDIAFVEIADASQLRTATAEGVGSRMAHRMANMAKDSNSVIAMNGDLFIKDPKTKKFEVRMTQVVTYEMKRNQTSKYKDTLIIDKNGDFHLFVCCEGMEEYVSSHKDEIVNAFMFGPALVIDGEISEIERKKAYDYAPFYRNPRSAIGQTGPLSYVMVVVEGRSGDRKGVTHAELAEIMLELGCVQAYNLDGGNSAELMMIGPDPDRILFHFEGQSGNRGQSDIIYFATAVPEEERR